jgi:hypothetical protein
MMTVTDLRRGGVELDVRAFIRDIRRQVRRQLPRGTRRAVVNQTAARWLASGEIPLPPGITGPPHLVWVRMRRNFWGAEYAMRCPGCWQPRRFLYRWPKEEWGWRCRRCQGLRYVSQRWPRMSPPYREIWGECELDVFTQRYHSLVGHVGRPPTRKL